MRACALVLLALVAACSTRPSGLPIAGAGGGGSGGSFAGGGSGGTGAGGSGGTGNGGSGGMCTRGEMPAVYLQALGIQDLPGRFQAQVTEHRRADPSEVPDRFHGADRFLEIREVRNADGHYRLWYHVPAESLAAPVVRGDDVQLTYEEHQPWGRSAAAVLRDGAGRLLWVIADGGFGDVPLARALIQVDPVDPPLCELDGGCDFRRHAARAILGEEVLEGVQPGTVVPLLGGNLWLGELAAGPQIPACTDVPDRVVGYAWTAAVPCGGFRGSQCGDGEFCSYPLFDCGATDRTGLCMTRPTACPENEDPVCGCDGNRYGNACQAGAAGTSIGFGPCDGLFRCGDDFCFSGWQYCQRAVSDVGGEPDSWSCRPLPDCKLGTGCDCVSAEPCGDFCSTDSLGNVTLTCPGG